MKRPGIKPHLYFRNIHPAFRWVCWMPNDPQGYCAASGPTPTAAYANWWMARQQRHESGWYGLPINRVAR